MPQISLRKFVKSLKQLSWTTTLGVIGSFVLVVVGALMTPFLLRYLLLPKTVTHYEYLDFTFRTCDDQLSGVCSYPEAVLALDELGIPLSPGYYYAVTLTLELFDSDQNSKLGVFQTQLTAKDVSGKVISAHKKPLLFRKSLFYSVFIMCRNVLFFPLYLIGYFSSSDMIQTILLTNHLYESYTRPIAYLSVQIQNRYVQVASAMLEIRALVGLSAYLFNEFPILSYVSIFGISFGINFGIFFLYWGSKGLSFYVQETKKEIDEELDEKIDEDRKGLIRTVVGYVFYVFTPLLPGFLKSKTKKLSRPQTPEPSPDVWNMDELPENQVVDNIPGWDVLPFEDEVDAVKALHKEIEKRTAMLPDDFMTGTRKRVRQVNAASGE